MGKEFYQPEIKNSPTDSLEDLSGVDKKKVEQEISKTGGKEKEPAAEGLLEKESAQSFEGRIKNDTAVFKSSLNNLEELFVLESPENNQIVEDKFSSTEQVQAELDKVLAQAKRFDSMHIQSFTVAQNCLAEIKSITFGSALDIQRFNSIIEKAAVALKFIQEAHDQITQSIKRVRDLERTYERVGLQEAGFDSSQDLTDKIIEIGQDIIKEKKRGILTRWRKKNRQQVGGLVKQQKELSALSGWQLPEIKLPEFNDYNQKRRFEELVVDFSKNTFSKIEGYYENSLAKENESEKSEELELNKESTDQLIDDLVEKLLEPALEKAKNRLEEFGLSDDEYKKRVNDFNPGKIADALALAREAIEFEYNLSWDAPKEAKEKSEMLKNKINGLSDNMRQEVNSFLIQNDRPQDKFKAINQMMIQAPLMERNQVVATSYGDILEKLGHTANWAKRFWEIYRMPTEFYDKQRQLAQTNWQKDINTFIEAFEPNHWDVFSKNSAIQEKFGQEQLDKAELFLSQKIIEKLLGTEEHTNESVNLGYKLMHFKNIENTPIAIMNTYRESGHSGERPFVGLGTRSEESPLYQWVSSFDEKDIASLKEKNIPGLSEIIDLIKNNSKDFTSSWIENPQIAEFSEKVKGNSEFLGSIAEDYFSKVEKIKISPDVKNDYFFDEKNGEFEISQTKIQEWLPGADLVGKIIDKDDRQFDEIKLAYARDLLGKAKIEPKGEYDHISSEAVIGQLQEDIRGILSFKVLPEKMSYFLQQLGCDSEIFGSKKSIKNPVYIQIQENLSEMASYYLEQGDQQMQIYLVGLLNRLESNLGANYEILIKILDKAQPMKDDKLRGAILGVFLDRMDGRRDGQATLALLRAYPNASVNFQELFNGRFEFISGLMSLEEIPEVDLATLAQVLEVPAQDLKSLFSFLKSIEESTKFSGSFYHYNCKIQQEFEDCLELAKMPEITDFIQELIEFGYSFDIEHSKDLQGLIQNKEGLISQLKDIRQLFSNFRYNFSSSSKFDQVGNKTETIYLTDPHELLLGQTEIPVFFDALYNFQTEHERSLDQNFTNGLMRSLRSSDPVLGEVSPENLTISQERYDLFHQKIADFIWQSHQSESPFFKNREIFVNRNALRFLARQPERFEEFEQLSVKSAYLFDTLLAEGGPLFSNKDNVIRDIFANGSVLRRAQEIESIFTKKTPYWEQLFLFTQARLAGILETSNSAYPITEILDVDLQNLVKRHKVAKRKNPEKLTRLESAISNDSAREQLLNNKIQAVPFSALRGVYKQVVFRDYLRRTVETSRQDQAKKAADFRNRQNVVELLSLKPGVFLHGSAIDNLESVLLSGNLPQEALGENAGADRYPFHVDFTNLEESFIKEKGSTKDVLINSWSAHYGQGGKLGAEGQIFYIYDRENTDWEKGKIYGPNSNHALLFGGIPATEISAIVLNTPDKTLIKARQAILENGFYVPIYDLDGKLLFSEREYDQLFEDLNLAVPVEVWDYSLKTGEQFGSNPGGEYTVPTKKGAERHYVKFGAQETKEEVQMWTEILADCLYRACKISVVDSQIVRCGGAYGRATKLINAKQEEIPDFSHGFLMDLLTQNYWDIRDANVIVDEKGETLRLDNGASFPEFRGTLMDYNLAEMLDKALAGNLPAPYKSIDVPELKNQAQNIVKHLKPERVETIIKDNVRLSKAMRDDLAKIINERVAIIKEKFGL